MRPRVQVKEEALRARSPSLFEFNGKLLQDPTRLYQFRKFVEAEYADESLLFYLDVTAWKAFKSPAAKTARAKELYDLYLMKGAAKQVNIPSTVVEATWKRFASGMAAWWIMSLKHSQRNNTGQVDIMFDEALAEVW